MAAQNDDQSTGARPRAARRGDTDLMTDVASLVYRARSAKRREATIVVNGLDHAEWQAIVRRAAYGPNGKDMSQLAEAGLKRLGNMRANEFTKTASRFLIDLRKRKGAVSIPRAMEPTLKALMEKHHKSQREVILVATAYEALEVLKERSLQSFNFIADLLRENWQDPAVRSRIARKPDTQARFERAMSRGLGKLKPGYDDGTALPEIATLINEIGYNATAVLAAANESASAEEFRARMLEREATS
ncbi:hypothetical protein [Caulobacter sp. X]|uniref:hypothetical protein n=1 Tax=Caulobacter sp. X TaxID=2048901 RepID=UPI0011786580|nr:hypothetical protein [Caulobacter sp. X]